MELHDQAMTLLRAGVAAAEPGGAVRRAMAAMQPPAVAGDWRIIAVGKAARAMAQAALAVWPGVPALVVTNAGNDAPLPGARVLTAGHPEPDAAGEAAALEVEAALAQARAGVLALISGGGSALLPAPVAGLSLADKQAVNRLLLASGADIAQVNLIRQGLSRLKGGGWLRVAGAPVVALILSDVPGDDLRVVASGPTVAPIGRRTDACALARRLGIWDAMPEAAREALRRADEVPRPAARNLLIGSNTQSLAAMARAGAQVAGALSGDVQDCAARLLQLARRAAPGQALVFGGETTVRLQGKGMGGRNQELALRFSLLARDLPGAWCFAAMGSDGRDGPGHAAGGIVGPGTLAAMRAAGVDPQEALARNDSTPALAAADALIVTGATGTNVADFAVFLRG